MSQDLTTLANMFKVNAQIFQKAVQGVPGEKWRTRWGEDSNHLAGIAGQVVVHRAMVAKILGQAWPAPWEELFARGAKLVAPKPYPAAHELQRSFEEVCEKLSAALPGATQELLGKPVLKEQPALDGPLGRQHRASLPAGNLSPRPDELSQEMAGTRPNRWLVGRRPASAEA